MNEKREELFNQLWQAQNEAYLLMNEYDLMPHYYGENVLYQAEAGMIYLIAENPGITATELADILKKTTSACSQIIRKLKNKGWVEQTRNKDNNRQFNLTLTKDAQKVYDAQVVVNRNCQQELIKLLEEFTEEELEKHVLVQRRINQAYEEDIRRSEEAFARAELNKE